MPLNIQSVKFFGHSCPIELRSLFGSPIIETNESIGPNRIEVTITAENTTAQKVTIFDIQSCTSLCNLEMSDPDTYFYSSKSIELYKDLNLLFCRIENEISDRLSLQLKKADAKALEHKISTNKTVLTAKELELKHLASSHKSEIELRQQYLSLIRSLDFEDNVEGVISSLRKWSHSLLEESATVEILKFDENATASNYFFEENLYIKDGQIIIPIMVQNELTILIRMKESFTNPSNYDKLLNLQTIYNQKLKAIEEQNHLQHENRIWRAALNQISLPILITDMKNQPIFKNSHFQELPLEEKKLTNLAAEKLELKIKGNIYSIEKTEFTAFQKIFQIFILHNMKEERERLLSSITSEKFNAIGRLGDKIAHELSNPIGGINNLIEVILSQGNLPKSHIDDLKQIKQGATRALAIIKALQDFANHQPLSSEIYDVNCLVEEALLFCKSLTRSIKIHVSSTGYPTFVKVHSELFKQVIFNLVQNAAQACQMKGLVQIDINTKMTKVTISVSDNGPGIPEHIRDKIFEPSFSTKGLGEGTGLGLALVQRSIEAWSGTISYEQSNLGGAKFTIELPIAFPNKTRDSTKDE